MGLGMRIHRALVAFEGMPSHGALHVRRLKVFDLRTSAWMVRRQWSRSTRDSGVAVGARRRSFEQHKKAADGGRQTPLIELAPVPLL